MRPTARSLIFDLLSTLRRGSMPVAALVQAGALFGVAEGAIRVALHRLLADGRLERDERGSYRLGPAAVPVQSIVSSWRDLDRRTRAWNGHWIAVHMPAGARRGGAANRSASALRLFGLAPLSPALYVRPANLRDGLDRVREALQALGLPDQAIVFEIAELDPGDDARARALWDGPALARDYRDARARIERSVAQLPKLSEAQAMTESFLLGGRIVQQLVLDPMLPAPLVDEDERRALLDSLRAYDRLGRDIWSGFMKRFGMPHRTAPSDSGWAADRWARSA